MKKLMLDVLSDSAIEELRMMENDKKIRILNEEDVRMMSEKRDQIWKELEQYTYENIIKNVKETV